MFIRPDLGYGNVIYDQPNNNGLSEKTESIRDGIPEKWATGVGMSIGGTPRPGTRDPKMSRWDPEIDKP